MTCARLDRKADIHPAAASAAPSHKVTTRERTCRTGGALEAGNIATYTGALASDALAWRTMTGFVSKSLSLRPNLRWGRSGSRFLRHVEPPSANRLGSSFRMEGDVRALAASLAHPRRGGPHQANPIRSHATQSAQRKPPTACRRCQRDSTRPWRRRESGDAGHHGAHLHRDELNVGQAAVTCLTRHLSNAKTHTSLVRRARVSRAGFATLSQAPSASPMKNRLNVVIAR